MRLLTPPVVAILITSTPRAIWRRTARRQSSAPSQVLPERSRCVVKLLADAERRIHVAGGRRDRGAGVDDARADRPAARDRVAQAQSDAVVGAEVADRGEAGVERLARVPRRFVGAQRDAVGDVGELALDAGPVGVEMDVAVDQPGQDEAVGKVDQPGARRHRHEAVLHRLDPPAADDDAGAAAAAAGPAGRAGCRHG